MIADPVFSSTLVACETLEEVLRVLDDHRIAVLLPSRIMFDLDPFERIWDITSDAMAAWFAWLVSANLLIILTDVDGVYSDARIGDQAALIREILATEISDLGHTAIDACTAPYLAAKGINCWVLNGNEPDRLIEAVEGREVVGTFVRG
jgi:aspartokinase-like uncharacterized kinase